MLPWSFSPALVPPWSVIRCQTPLIWVKQIVQMFLFTLTIRWPWLHSLSWWIIFAQYQWRRRTLSPSRPNFLSFWWHSVSVSRWTNIKHCQRHNGPRVLSLKHELSLKLKWIQIQFSQKDDSSYRLNTLGPLCLWQCFNFSPTVFIFFYFKFCLLWPWILFHISKL